MVRSNLVCCCVAGRPKAPSEGGAMHMWYSEFQLDFWKTIWNRQAKAGKLAISIDSIVILVKEFQHFIKVRYRTNGLSCRTCSWKLNFV